MTTTTPDTIGIAAGSPRPSARTRFGIAFLVGLVAALLLGAGALYAYDQQYAGRILPGVSIGSVDVSGLEPSEAAALVHEAYGDLRDGRIILEGPDGPMIISFAEIRREVDADGLIAEAMALGRSGKAPLWRRETSSRSWVNVARRLLELSMISK